jgi:hypothetical protein
MTCGCKKKHKRGSGKATFLSGATFRGYPKGSGMRVSGGAMYKKRRKKKKERWYDYDGRRNQFIWWWNAI